MKGILPITVALSLMPLGPTPNDFEIRTSSNGVLCATPFQLRKAIVASSRGDERRIRQLGCIRTNDGAKAILLDNFTPPAGPWQVRLMLDGAPAVIMWGYASSFRPPAN
jgi:hypothetical protein